MSTRVKDTEAYIRAQPADARATLERMRLMIKAASPEAVEAMAYGMVGYKYRGRPLLYIGAAKNHCGIYGSVPEGFEKELAKYETSKGTIRIPFGKPPPQTLVRKLVRARMAAIEEAEAAKRKKPAAKKLATRRTA
jgi:uncharacterized protein YdhG (YjbR/CyaY superfamily)